MEKQRKNRALAAFFAGAVQCIRPLLGPPGMCIFAPYTCTMFAQDQLSTQPFLKALAAISWRLLCCNPINGLWRRYSSSS